MPHLMVRGFTARVKPGGQFQARKWTVIGTLLLSDIRFANMGEIARMGRSAVGEMLTGFIQAEQAVDGKAGFSGVLVFLAVVLPPANGAQRQRACRFKRLVSATGTTKTCLRSFHIWMDEVP